MNFSFNPPINTSMLDQKGIPTKTWSAWFGNIFQTPAQGKPWVPVLSGITTTGAYIITGEWNRIGPMLYFSILITPSSGNTTASGALITNLPFENGYGQTTAFNASTREGVGSALVTSSVSVPNWSALTVPVQIIGFCQVGGN